jgi:hypothetical protein
MTTIRVRTQRSPTAADGKKKIALLADKADDGMNRDQVRRFAQRHGFKEVAPNQFVHRDGSWFKRDADNYDSIEVGVKGAKLYEVPAPYVPLDRSVKRDTTTPDIARKGWAWFTKNTALGKVPMIDSGAAGKMVLMKKGFVPTNRRDGVETWVHPDGSWFKLHDGYGGITCGWKGFELGDLPYNR